MKLKTKLLENQMKKAKKSVKKLKKCTEEYYLGNTERVRELRREISKLEDETDYIKEKAQLHWANIESDFRTKNSALELTQKISLIADYAEDVSLLLIMRKDSIPIEAWADFKKFMDVVSSSVSTLQKTILVARSKKTKKCKDCDDFKPMYDEANMGRCKKLDENRYFPGFRDENQGCDVKEKEEVYKLCAEVSQSEDEADKIERNLRGKIYREEMDQDTMAGMHFLKIVENFDMIANTAEDCANCLKTMY